jgi:putative flippase GtrA
MPTAFGPPRRLVRQFAVFLAVGLSAFVVHYGLLVAGVEALGLDPVPAALIGYAAGGLVSYRLNRRHTFASARPHAEAGWRFAAVALVGLGVTFALMAALTRRLGLPYLPAQVATTALILVWNFVANRLWTFPAAVPLKEPATR